MERTDTALELAKAIIIAKPGILGSNEDAVAAKAWALLAQVREAGPKSEAKGAN